MVDAKQELAAYTCVLWKGSRVYRSTRRGVAPLLEILDSGADVRGFQAADRVVGRAGALLYCLLGVKSVYAPVMSRAAEAILVGHGIMARTDSLVDGIRSRTGDGPCPMEQATRDITDPAQAPDVIRSALRALQKP